MDSPLFKATCSIQYTTYACTTSFGHTWLDTADGATLLFQRLACVLRTCSHISSPCLFFITDELIHRISNSRCCTYTKYVDSTDTCTVKSSRHIINIQQGAHNKTQFSPCTHNFVALHCIRTSSLCLRTLTCCCYLATCMLLQIYISLHCRLIHQCRHTHQRHSTCQEHMHNGK